MCEVISSEPPARGFNCDYSWHLCDMASLSLTCPLSRFADMLSIGPDSRL